MSILETFYLLFESNADKAKKGIKDVEDATDGADKRLSSMDHHVRAVGEKIVETFKEVGAAVAAAFAVHELKAFISDNIEFNAQLGITAERLGIAVEDLDAYSSAAKRVGGTQEGFAASLDALNRGMADIAVKGTSRLKPFFDELGIHVVTAQGRVKGLLPVIGEMADKFQQMSAQERAGFAEKFGIDQGTLMLLASGRRGLDDLVARQKELGVSTEADTERAHAFAQQWDDLATIFRHVGTVIVGGLIGPLAGVTRAITTFVQFLQDHGPFVRAFFELSAGAITVLYLPAIIRAAAATWAFLAPWLVAAAPFLAMIAVVGALALAYDDLVAFFNGKKSIIGEWVAHWKWLGDTIKWVADKWDKVGRFFSGAAATVQARIDGKSKEEAYAAGVKAAQAHGSPAMAATDKAIAQAKKTFPQEPPHSAQQEALEFFKSKGWTAEQAAGIVANLSRESSLNPKATGDNGQAFGLAQWHPDRQKAFAEFSGKDIRNSTYQEQLAFVDHELRAGTERAAGKALEAAKTASEAAGVVARKYERPAHPDEEAAVRGRAAAVILMTPTVPATPAQVAALPDIAGMVSAGRQQIATADTTPLAAQTSRSVAPPNVSKEYNITVQNVSIQTDATDADGIAREVGGSLRKEMRQAIAHFDDGVAA